MCHCHVLQSFCEFIISLAMDSTSDVSVLQLDNPVQIFYQVWYLKGMPIRRKLNDVVDGLAIIIGPVHRYPFFLLRWFEDVVAKTRKKFLKVIFKLRRYVQKLVG